jgi:cytochrome oxidase Cu insertion factor (SCO1/SenC/PrrC family)
VPYVRVSRGSDYSLDHGSGIFIVGPDAGINAYLSAPHDAAIIARDFRRVLEFTG